MARMSAVTSRARLVLALEWGARRYPAPLRRSSIRSLPGRWLAALRGTRRTTWMGSPVKYEVRFDSILMHVHQALAVEVLQETDLTQGASVLDIGGNIGQFGIAMLSLRPDLDLLSLEPNPACHPILRTNASAQRNWQVIPKGLSSEPGPMTFWFVPGKTGQGSIHRNNAHLNVLGADATTVREATVDFIAADQLLYELPAGISPSFELVKVDVEGHERMVVPEVAKLQWRYLLIEVGEGRDGGLSDDGVRSLLAEHGIAVRMLLRSGADDDTTYDVLYERVGSST